MADSWDDMRRAKEESYFDKKNREAIERLSKKKENQGPRPSPITGKPMEQVVLHGVVLDRCVDSGGFWLDAGELEQLLEAGNHEKSEKATLDFFKGLIGLKTK